ncbi:hypothetical protein GW819_03270 [Candidatus Gracilibacteria bacterium]|nr:hypothetical protein [bacterium]NDK19836.1 hypothetical protein [Candidatus Gracilibacteria bacterium]OIO77310.1 MAG: hypothetical protein AUJ87_01545 [Candidatus Gracilibacteria bacterium CG1_02_38_174]PIQ11232.1 MAG: hypothetical protein COW68_03135 [Candidatus Gracilibacteria bacterium CG18_big_fil_WC_8_21_14_2_50_38_16]PIQ41082.1 MAG: hypothetical protein COW06_04125 [Candidatus Gracilibacteria bacterium CG12_big_fil_rev_8_21_14_0_65_38_15]PIZ01466.1 MAG: hypothetical protein COY60_0333
MSSDTFLDELSADLIETSEYKDYPEGTLGAIQYLSKQNLSKLQSGVEKNILENEIIAIQKAEKKIIKGFENFLPKGGVRITLTKEEKTKNIDFLIEPISYLFTLRNKYNPEELKKLDILQSSEDTPEYILSLDFKKNIKTEIYFIKNIQILKKEIPKKHDEELDQYLKDNLTDSSQ